MLGRSVVGFVTETGTATFPGLPTAFTDSFTASKTALVWPGFGYLMKFIKYDISNTPFIIYCNYTHMWLLNIETLRVFTNINNKILAVLVIGLIALSMTIRMQPLEYGWELDGMDSFYNYRVLNYLEEN